MKIRKNKSQGLAAAKAGISERSARRIEHAVTLAGELPDVKRLREEFAPRKAELPQVTVEIPAASVYDALLPSEQEDESEEVTA